MANAASAADTGTGLMKPLPWKSLSEIEPAHEYVALATFFHLKSFLTTFRFLRMARRVMEQLEAGPPGLVGFSLRAKPLSRRYWTLSVWEDGQELMNFIRNRPHLTAMEQLAPKMRVFDSARWSTLRGGYPPPWVEAYRRLSEKRVAG
jgi:hypothetical protein